MNAQAQLTVLNRVGSDTFSIGTIMLFSAASGAKWYYVKIAEETWASLRGGNPGTKALEEYVLDAVNSEIGYFEVYEVSIKPAPFFTSA